MSNLLSIVFPCCAYVSSVMRSSWHFSSSGFNIRFPRTPQNENKYLKKCSSDYFHILHIVELWCDFKKFVGPWSIYIFIKCLWVLLTNVFWFRATGGYICGCGRPSNLVFHLNIYWISLTILNKMAIWNISTCIMYMYQVILYYLFTISFKWYLYH